MSDYAIKVENLSKDFLLPHNRSTSLKQKAINLIRKDNYAEVQHALRDVSFEVKKGEFFGIVGRNGSGKSTLLKILARIYHPTSGSVKVNGSLVPFIELGVGFNPELSGRDNVFLNGALLGFSRKEIAEMYDEIVEFAELERFMDQKLKNYSSGMQVRLAFSIAIRAQSDILLIDEVLAVGDEAFQKKCIDVFEKYKTENKTVILVTHNMSIIEKYCDRAILLESGKVIDAGDPLKISSKYFIENSSRSTRDKRTTKEVSLKVSILNSNQKDQRTFNINEEIIIKLEWKARDALIAGVALLKDNQVVFATNTINAANIKNCKSILFSLKPTIGAGNYRITAGIFGKDRNDVIEYSTEGNEFRIVNKDPGNSLKEEWEGITYIKNKWITP